MQIQNRIGDNLVNVPEFAKLKNVSIPAVWKAIKANKIAVVLVGKKNNVFIDFENYENYKFNERRKHNARVED